ncbi:amino acid ABC transporter ATP-binding protein [Bacillus sp. OxB-1]|uniref:amino acid ABC transporter permease n=1 Tax=Bacillus sp. (strain OxB-1) TaxID=98228 RepID=UPI000581EA13|nr:amino acid ABC transporter permease [Bacillus sp. OxB-1]BAQ11997.1 amino acid ABC transporter ATP-binding protein [Bacillus sp. OxB-1]
MNFDIQYMLQVFPTLIKYIPLTLGLAVISMIFAIFIGLIMALITKYKVPVLHQLTAVILSFFRAIPMLALLFLIYFGLPQIIPSLSILNAVTAAIIGLSMKNAAYLAEIFRAAINSVDEGQLEACHSIGMTKFQAMVRIVLPQAVRNAVPATGNIFIGLVKETSLAFTLGVAEIFAQGKMMASASLNYFETYLAVALIYWMLTIIYTFLQGMLERRLNKPYEV